MNRTYSRSLPLQWRHLILVGLALLAGAISGTALSFASNGGLPAILTPGGNDGTASLADIAPGDAGAPIAERSSEGFGVTLASDEVRGDSRILGYTVSLPGGGFTDMLGIPRIVNPDGTFALPSEYGILDTFSADSGRPGLADGAASAAIFDSAMIQPGAMLRFGPFFRALDSGFTVQSMANELERGVETTIGGEPFMVTLTKLEGGLHEIRFQPLTKDGRVVASHPTSRVTVTAGSSILKDVRGSTNFAKTEELDVDANASAVVVAGEIPGDVTVTISIDSIGMVVKGQWDFPLD